MRCTERTVSTAVRAAMYGAVSTVQYVPERIHFVVVDDEFISALLLTLLKNFLGLTGTEGVMGVKEDSEGRDGEETREPRYEG